MTQLHLRLRPRGRDATCGYCRAPDSLEWACPTCDARFHIACMREFAHARMFRCVTPGCDELLVRADRDREQVAALRATSQRDSPLLASGLLAFGLLALGLLLGFGLLAFGQLPGLTAR